MEFRENKLENAIVWLEEEGEEEKKIRENRERKRVKQVHFGIWIFAWFCKIGFGIGNEKIIRCWLVEGMHMGNKWVMTFEK